MRRPVMLSFMILFCLAGTALGTDRNGPAGIRCENDLPKPRMTVPGLLSDADGGAIPVSRPFQSGPYPATPVTTACLATKGPCLMEFRTTRRLLRPPAALMDPKPAGKPPHRSERIAGEFLAGAATGILSGCATYRIIGDYQKSSPEDSGVYGHLALILAGYSFGTHLGVYLVGTMGDETGSYFAALAGSVVGFFGGIVLAPVTIGASMMIFPLLGSIWLFNLTREFEPAVSAGTAMIFLQNGKAALGIPEISSRPIPRGGESSSTVVRLICVAL